MVLACRDACKAASGTHGVAYFSLSIKRGQKAEAVDFCSLVLICLATISLKPRVMTLLLRDTHVFCPKALFPNIVARET